MERSGLFRERKNRFRTATKCRMGALVNFHSVTLSSVELEAEGDGTRVSYTEQIFFLDGKDGTADPGTELPFGMIETTPRPSGVMQ
jgi:hypothetical protein